MNKTFKVKFKKFPGFSYRGIAEIIYLQVSYVTKSLTTTYGLGGMPIPADLKAFLAIKGIAIKIMI